MEPSQVSGHNKRLQIHGPLGGKDRDGEIANVFPRARLQPVKHLDMSYMRCSLWCTFRHEVHEGHAVEEDESLLVEQRCSFGVDGFASCKNVGDEGLHSIVGLGSVVIIMAVAEVDRASVAVAARASGGPDCLGSCAASHGVSVPSLGGEEIEGWAALLVQLIGYEAIMVNLVTDLGRQVHEGKDFVFWPRLA